MLDAKVLLAVEDEGSREGAGGGHDGMVWSMEWSMESRRARRGGKQRVESWELGIGSWELGVGKEGVVLVVLVVVLVAVASFICSGRRQQLGLA